MQMWAQWLRQPQTLWIRRAVFQVHLWTGLAIGLYIVMLSLTGTVLVYRVELERMFQTPRPVFEPNRTRLSTEQLTAAAQQAYPDWKVTRVGSRVTRRNPVIEVWVERNGEKKERLFNPYTGADLGDAIPARVRALDWVAELHDHLLLEETGSLLNAAGSGVVTVLGLHMGTLLGGTVLVEYVFNWPGLSTPLLRAVEARDYPMVVGIVLTISGLFLLINLLMDLVYAALDPRVRAA